ncbi:MAG TPA: hypothetical protein VMX58_00240 [Patescibacteria group bacterium]|nr:hypothetical protein [Patescibacteria group bacterium]
MRGAITCVIAVIVSAGLLGCGHPSGKLVGSWEMVIPSGTSTERFAGDPPVKILTETHFAFGCMGPDGIMYAGGGRYTLDGDTYTETIAYHFNPKLAGRTLSFTCRLDGDRWHHSGIFEIDGERFNIEEIWRRIR